MIRKQPNQTLRMARIHQHQAQYPQLYCTHAFCPRRQIYFNTRGLSVTLIFLLNPIGEETRPHLFLLEGLGGVELLKTQMVLRRKWTLAMQTSMEPNPANERVLHHSRKRPHQRTNQLKPTQQIQLRFQISNITDTPHDDYKNHRPQVWEQNLRFYDVPKEKIPRGTQTLPSCSRDGLGRALRKMQPW